MVRAAAGRLILLYLADLLQPLAEPDRDALAPLFRREVTHCELFPSVEALVAAAYDFFERHNRRPRDVLSIIGSDAAEINSSYRTV